VESVCKWQKQDRCVCNIEKPGLRSGKFKRGGTPLLLIAGWSRYGAASVRLAASGGFGRMVAMKNAQITDVSFYDALAVPKRVDIHGDAVITARGLGISFGDKPET
jgi:hypothetical protein